MNISTKINYSVYGAEYQIRESLDGPVDNALDASVYDVIDEIVCGSVWNSFDDIMITSVEQEIWDYEYDKEIN